MNKTTAILASFATLKSLNEKNKYKSSYQLLAEFINYIIQTKKLLMFTAIEMRNYLFEIFGFDLPEVVVKRATDTLSCTKKDKGAFSVEKKAHPIDTTIDRTKIEVESQSSKILKRLVSYIREREPDIALDLVALEQDFISFLIDNRQKVSVKHLNFIGEFIIASEDDKEMQECLDNIREGSLLYIGINYNINDVGSLTKPLTLFLGTEVLFSLAGYNGEIHKQLSEDFITQVRNANISGKKIHLRYFYEIKREIEDFFTSAESIVEGKSVSVGKPAMKEIINGCDNKTDVLVKKADFYHLIQNIYGIHEDTTDYYIPTLDPYNLESLEHDPQLQDEWKFVSHINKLRKGQRFEDNLDSEFLVVTNKSSTLRISKEQSDALKERFSLDWVNDYAVSVDYITNLLWYKLGNSFNKKALPLNINAVLKAKVALSSVISHNILTTYQEAREQFNQGIITETQLVSRILALQNKPLLPEELEAETIEDSMDFSEELLSRYEEESRLDKESLKRKDQELVLKNAIIESQQEKNQELEAKLRVFEEKEETREKRKDKIKRITLFSFNILWKIAIIVLITVGAILIEKKYQTNFLPIVCGVVDLLLLIGTAWATIKKDLTKYFPKDPKEKDD